MTTAVATATGASAAISLPAGEYVLQFTSAGAFVLDVQVGDGTDFNDLYYSDGSTQVTIDSSSGPRHVSVPGAMTYRMYVGTYNSAITMVAKLTSGKTWQL